MSPESCPKEIRIYETEDGKEPFYEWLYGLSDKKTRARIHKRLGHVRLGNLGDHKAVGEGVLELREHYGPGYRIYCGQDGNEVVILLCAGDKDSQEGDIKKAQEYWSDYRRRDDA